MHALVRSGRAPASVLAGRQGNTRRADLPLEQFTSNDIDAVKNVDGTDLIDMTVRFSVIGASFLVLVEREHEQRKVERQAVKAPTGAQTGMLLSQAGFQSGAVEYAIVHGITLI